MSAELVKGSRPYSAPEIGQMLDRIAYVAKANGHDLNRIVDRYAPNLVEQVSYRAYGSNPHGDGMCGVDSVRNATAWSRNVPLDVASNCPTDAEALLTYLGMSLCSYNRMGNNGQVTLLSNILPMPDAQFGFNISPEQASLGQFFLPEWALECMYMAIARVKVQFIFTQVVGLTQDVLQDNFSAANVSIIQVGSQEATQIAANLGVAQDAAPSDFIPAYGGFWFRPDQPFPINPLNPQLFAFSIRHQAIGTPGVDTYNVQVQFLVYMEIIPQLLKYLKLLR